MHWPSLLLEYAENLLKPGFQIREKDIPGISPYRVSPEPLPCTFDGHLFFVEKPLDLQNHLEVFFLVGSLVGIRPLRPDLWKLTLPVSQDIGFNADDPTHFADPKKSPVIRYTTHTLSLPERSPCFLSNSVDNRLMQSVDFSPVKRAAG